MNRRDLALALLGSSLLSHSSWAQQNSFVEGKDYFELRQKVATDAPTGQVEVIEFFWYSCPHCFQFEPQFAQWHKAPPKGVVVKRVPIAFREDFAPQQRLYYALDALGLVDKLHAVVFNAIHVQKKPLKTDAEILSWIGQQAGVDATKFQQAYQSFGVAAKVRRATQLQNEYRIEGVPSFGIAGRFYTDGSLAGGMPRALQVVESLAARALSGR